ncbi:hypothetical protein [Salinimicrobium oceani]|uniref:PH domain-containing protein n=1 Tax=Salinimicrobium oceani TaxID=2722702 RepID=A0ABX1D4B5_9FLAO|nr:hypothetical protein [Salinimicrobium oceani]NJW54182.1 hypothetical protein [Salinimicrobium oceani]
MLFNISKDFSEKREEINDLVGKPFSLEERKKLDGVSLQNLTITAASIEIYNLLVLNEGNSQCHLEIRPKGVIISFRAATESYSLVIPFFKLKIYKGRAEEYSFYKDNYFIKIWAGAEDKELHAFIKKLRHYKADKALPRIEDEN